MFIPTDERRLILKQLFQDGVLVAKKDFNQPKHEYIPVKNLYVIKSMQSLNSRGYVKTQYSWQHYYYILTDEGVDYLREWLHLPEHVVPETHKSFEPSRPRYQDARGKATGGRPQFRN